jgi:hypothetical protein
MKHPKAKLSLRVCVLTEAQLTDLRLGIVYPCSKHATHILRTKALRMVRSGELRMIGKHCAVRIVVGDWKKVYTRNKYGEVLHCGMQLKKPKNDTERRTTGSGMSDLQSHGRDTVQIVA